MERIREDFTQKMQAEVRRRRQMLLKAWKAGASVMLIDEDTSATNFMIRDELMQRVIHRDMEPITPFIDRILELYQVYGISTVIVAGSSGAYFHIADTIIQMDRYEPKEITKLAKETAKEFPGDERDGKSGGKTGFHKMSKTRQRI